LASLKMAFISGPRQVGKTFLSQRLLSSPENYKSWDDVSFKKQWTKNPVELVRSLNEGPVIFDELHKCKKWKPSLKGVYDVIGLIKRGEDKRKVLGKINEIGNSENKKNYNYLIKLMKKVYEENS